MPGFAGYQLWVLVIAPWIFTPTEAEQDAGKRQGLTLVHFSAELSTFCGTRWVPVDVWVITRHKLDTQRLTDQNGLS